MGKRGVVGRGSRKGKGECRGHGRDRTSPARGRGEEDRVGAP